MLFTLVFFDANATLCRVFSDPVKNVICMMHMCRMNGSPFKEDTYIKQKQDLLFELDNDIQRMLRYVFAKHGGFLFW